MRKIIEGIEFCRREHYDCTQQALQVVLQFYGYKVEDILFDEWRFTYGRGNAGDIQISPGRLDMIQKFSDYGIPLLFRRAADAEETWSAMKQRIDERNPVPVLVDVDYLDYYSSEVGPHSPHYVILEGYDEERKTVHITDPSPWQLFKGDIPHKKFEKALYSPYLYNRNHWVEFEFPAQPVRHNPDTLRTKISRNVEVMLQGGWGTNTFFGMEGVRTFAQEVEKWASMDRELLVGYMKTCFGHLGKVACRLDGHAHFLTSAGEILRSPELRGISLEVGKLAQSWFIQANMFFKGSKKEPFAMLPRIHRKLLDIADREEEVLIALRGAIKT